MTEPDGAASTRHNKGRSRYERDTEHGLAIAVYRQQGDQLIFTHTEVPSESEGKGIGSQLVRDALDDARRRGFRIVPACSFVADFVRRHPEYESPGDQDA
ncbi:MAG: hypothetical protein A3D94_04150 [Alphaproteobacteria bacterium RIFCSPHIGHO2_12_FULL_66_14]|jgi:predicted GNAT family acetyltransferase|nr:MAG: hypothetical protein A3D94_04150 [Alphaproteobacteria bacterium RIFCSPHIGHO2_12_FULL_66_14]